MDAALSVRTKAVNFESSLREARLSVIAKLRDIDTETVGVVSAIALDEITSQKAVEAWSNGCSFVRENKICKPWNFSQRGKTVGRSRA